MPLPSRPRDRWAWQISSRSTWARVAFAGLLPNRTTIKCGTTIPMALLYRLYTSSLHGLHPSRERLCSLARCARGHARVGARQGPPWHASRRRQGVCRRRKLRRRPRGTRRSRVAARLRRQTHARTRTHTHRPSGQAPIRYRTRGQYNYTIYRASISCAVPSPATFDGAHQRHAHRHWHAPTRTGRRRRPDHDDGARAPAALHPSTSQRARRR